MKRTILTTLILASAGISPLVAQRNAGDPGSLERAESDALAELENAIANRNYTLIGEAAEQLDSIEKRKKAIAQGQPDPGDSPFGTDTFGRLKEKGWSLGRSPDGPDSEKPARFSFTKDIQAESVAVLDAEFYLRKRFPAGGALQPKPIRDGVFGFNELAISVQGKLSSSDETETDAWRFRLEDRFFTHNSNPGRIFDGLVFDFALKEESDRDFDVARISGELMATANKQSVAMGRFSGSSDSPVQLLWRPWVGIDFGKTVKGEELLSASADDAVRLIARGTVDLQLNFLTKALNLKSSRLFIDDTLRFLPEAGETHNYLTTGFDFGLSEHLGFGVDYTIGRDAPKFEREEMLKASFTVQF